MFVTFKVSGMSTILASEADGHVTEHYGGEIFFYES